MSDPEVAETDVNPIKKYFSEFKVLKETRREYWGLQGVNMLDCLAYFAMLNIAVVTLSNDFGFNDVQAGLVYMVFGSLTTISLFFTGLVTDWLGVKRALYVAVLGLLAMRIGMVATAYMAEPVRLYDDTDLSVLDDGRGLPVAGGPDLKITARDGSEFTIDLGDAKTVAQALTAINGATGGKVEASIAAGGKRLQLVDKTHANGKLIVNATEGNPKAAEVLGLATDGAETDQHLGKRILTDLDGVEMSKLNQGEGLAGAKQLVITDRAGKKITVDDVSGYATPKALVAAINAKAEEVGAKITASISNPGTGLRITDETGIKDGATLIAGDAAPVLLFDPEETGPSISSGNLVDNPLRSTLVVVFLAAMAPFMAMLQTVFQAGNRRFTTKRSRGAGFNLWYLFMNVGAAGGGFLIDIIYLDMDLPQFHVFTFGAIMGVLCLVVIFLTIKNTDQLKTPEEEAEAAAAGGGAEEKKGRQDPWTIFKAVVSESIFWRFTLLITLLLGVRAVFLYLGLLHPKFWYRVIGPDARVGALQAFNPVLVIIGLILIIPILNRFSVYKMLVYGALITSLSMFIIAIPPMGDVDVATWTYGTTIVFLLVLTVGELIWSPRLSEYTAAIAPVGQEGTYLGLSMVPYFAAKMVVSGLSGAMLSRWCPEPPESNPLLLQQQIANREIPFVDSPYMMFTILGAIALVGTLAALFGRRWFTMGAKL